MGWGLGGNMMRSRHEGLSTGKGRLKVVMLPCQVTPQVEKSGPNSCSWRGLLHRCYGAFAWTHLANGKGPRGGRSPSLCGPNTEQ